MACHGLDYFAGPVYPAAVDPAGAGFEKEGVVESSGDCIFDWGGDGVGEFGVALEERGEDGVTGAGGVREEVPEEDGAVSGGRDGLCFFIFPIFRGWGGEAREDGLRGEGGEIRGDIGVKGEEVAVDEGEHGEDGEELGHGGEDEEVRGGQRGRGARGEKLGWVEGGGAEGAGVVDFA